MPEQFRFDFSFQDMSIDVDQIGRLLDYDRGDNKEMISEMVSEALKDAVTLCEIRAEFAIWSGLSFGPEASVIRINDVQFNTGKIVAGQLRRSESVAVFACTAGHKIGEMAKTIMNEKDFLKGYIYDMIGSQTADSAAELMQDKLRILAEQMGLKITNRYSPGYCGWSVSEQHKLFSLIPDNYCRIRLNTFALMDPIKSVSGIIGLGKKVRFNEYTCNLCDQQNCIYRKFRSS